MNTRFVSALCFLTIIAPLLTGQSPQAGGQNRVPILVELFTSEGCSSCPPADAFLQKLDEQPVDGAEFIVLSEHVDYWNHDGWKDPYSSAELTARQQGYATKFHLNSPYTPQMVLDATTQFVGSSVDAAQKAIAESLLQPKIAVRISHAAVEQNRARAHLEVGPVEFPHGVRAVDVYVVIALNHAESQVLRGENANRRLSHAAVVRQLLKLGKAKSGEHFERDVDLKIDDGSQPHNLRFVAFLQDQATGKIVGASAKPVDASAQHP